MVKQQRSQNTLNAVYQLASDRAHDRKLHGGYVHRPYQASVPMNDLPPASDQMMPVRQIGSGQYGDAGMIGYGMDSGSDEEVKPVKIKKPRVSKKSKMMDNEEKEETHKMVEQGKKHMKRADIVRKVMKEQNLSMINASKYVKEHGLY
jgi:hypothetical protein